MATKDEIAGLLKVWDPVKNPTGFEKTTPEAAKLIASGALIRDYAVRTDDMKAAVTVFASTR